jgi:hypothetical protein
MRSHELAYFHKKKKKKMKGKDHEVKPRTDLKLLKYLHETNLKIVKTLHNCKCL